MFYVTDKPEGEFLYTDTIIVRAKIIHGNLSLLAAHYVILNFNSHARTHARAHTHTYIHTHTHTHKLH